MEALEIKTIFSFSLFGYSIPITETVLISWLVMVVIIAASIVLTSKLKEVPDGPQVILESGVEFLNNYTKNQFGSFSRFLGPYMGTLFLFLLIANIIPVVSPLELKVFGREFIPLFTIKPPARDINVSAALAVISILIVLVCGFSARGFSGWFKHLLHPLPMMLPFNVLDFGTRLMSLTLRLFGNILGGFVLMSLVESVFPVVFPAILALYFDLFDGLLQAGIFVFLTGIYITEAVNLHKE